MTEEENSMVKRFQKWRWCDTRHKIHDLDIGESVSFQKSQHSNARHGVERLNEAYQGEREWEYFSKNREVTATRIN